MSRKNFPHASSGLREAFLDWLDSFEPDRIQEVDLASFDRFARILRECGDVLPSQSCDHLDIPKGSTYGAAITNLENWFTERSRI